MEIRHSVCALDCPDTCAILVHVEDGRATKLRGDPDHPVTRGFLCGKVAQYLEREYSPERLLYPQKRVGAKGSGEFERISWDEALDTIAERLHAISQEFGSEAILPYSYAGTMGILNTAGMDRRFFHRLGAPGWIERFARQPEAPRSRLPWETVTGPSRSNFATRN